MRTVIVELKQQFRYEIETPDDEPFETDGVPWADSEIKQYFIEQTAEDVMNGAVDSVEHFNWLKNSMEARIIG